MKGLFEHLRQAARPNWDAYVDHAFVRLLAANRLPVAAFRFYLVQDYLFLIQFARAQALAVYKARDLAEMRASRDALSAILDETNLHVRLCAGWGVGEADLEAVPEHPATIAYTRFVLDCGMAGDLLDLRTALAPCVVGYGEIARRIGDEVRGVPGHAQRDWIAEYESDSYQAVAARARCELDRLAEGMPPASRLRRLEGIFRTACDLEADFWQMALDGSRSEPARSGGASPCDPS